MPVDEIVAPAPTGPARTLRLVEDTDAPLVSTAPRLSDVDGWGRSERARALARRVLDPVDRHWFRTEWDGIEQIPDTGGALLVANHAGAIPPDAAFIMHGVES